MTQTDSIAEASTAVRKMWERHGIQQPFRFLGFCLSLLPIPVISQVGQALDRHLSDKAFEHEVRDLWAELDVLNARVSELPTLETAIQEVAKTLSNNASLSSKVRVFLNRLAPDASEFAVLTESGSYQQIVNSIVTADISRFVATSGSNNVLIGTTINSHQTSLHATGGSKNYVDGSSFNAPSGSVKMQQITTTGPINVGGDHVGFGKDGSIGFGEGGVLSFGPPAFEVSACCPNCKATITGDKRTLAMRNSVQCQSCKAIVTYDPKTLL